LLAVDARCQGRLPELGSQGPRSPGQAVQVNGPCARPQRSPRAASSHTSTLPSSSFVSHALDLRGPRRVSLTRFRSFALSLPPPISHLLPSLSLSALQALQKEQASLRNLIQGRKMTTSTHSPLHTSYPQPNVAPAISHRCFVSRTPFCSVHHTFTHSLTRSLAHSLTLFAHPPPPPYRVEPRGEVARN
jgi:hypothetical protein